MMTYSSHLVMPFHTNPITEPLLILILEPVPSRCPTTYPDLTLKTLNPDSESSLSLSLTLSLSLVPVLALTDLNPKP